ncbi:protein FrlC [Breznakia blatticola]|uniref:Protein FrlC n=1 Tax=Breznakia blatticola TaxID=1754012 RepID=A0A4R8A5S3_9FIRM|nr:sugar phosphate isomerase/epimerase family protein [Breznakia blatticola]TDW25753.1 protein FrlC [Breznakia blatticola]
MKYALMNTHHRFYTLDSFFKHAHENGAKYVELWLGPMHFYVDYNGYEDIQRLQDLQRIYDVQIIGICPEQTNPKPNNVATGNEDAKKRVFSYFKNAIDLAKAVNAGFVVVTPGWAYYDESIEEARKRSASMLHKLADYAKQQGIFLAIEALQNRESRIANSASELAEFLSLVNHDNVKVCLDIGAMVAAKDSVDTYFKVFNNRIQHCHFVDGKPTGHMALGTGELDLQTMFAQFYKHHYGGFYSFETVDRTTYANPAQADAQSIAYFEVLKQKKGVSYDR